jgi:carboxyl-terminal processing protease
VLIGPYTNSAAEITAEVLKFHRRACVVGQKTAGNVLTARTFALPDGGQIEIPVKNYLAPSGRSLEGVGVVPDIVLTAEEITKSSKTGDPELDRALDALQASGCH